MAKKMTTEDARARMISEALRRHGLPEGGAALVSGENETEIMASTAALASVRVLLSK